MSVTWNNKEYQPEKVIEKVEAARKTGSDGKKVQFIGWGFQEFAALIYSMLEFSNEIPEIDARGFVSKAIFNAGAKGEITKKSLIAEINKLEKTYLSLPIEKYSLASSISLSSSWAINKIKTANSTIFIERSLPAKFEKERESLLKNADNSIFASRPTNYLGVRVVVSAKSIYHAAEQALDVLDFNRGVWNWLLNRRYTRRMSWAGKSEPVNNILLGPIHTLHKPNGKLATTEVWWYEPNYLGAIKLYSPRQGEMEKIGKSFEYVKKIFKKHKYQQIIQNAFIRYTRSLDERDWATAFIKLWGILELLTDTGKANCNETIKRVAFLYQDREYTCQVLQHLRKYRNSSVHFDKGNSEIEVYMYQLKNYVEALLDFHLINKFGFGTIQEAADFLSLPYEEKTLLNQEKEFSEKIKKRKLARKFRGYT